MADPSTRATRATRGRGLRGSEGATDWDPTSPEAAHLLALHRQGGAPTAAVWPSADRGTFRRVMVVVAAPVGLAVGAAVLALLVQAGLRLLVA